MKYYMRVDDNPNSDIYNKPMSLHRFDVTKKTVITEWWNPTTKKWEDNPGLIAKSGIGGADDYFAVSEEKAIEFQKSSPRILTND